MSQARQKARCWCFTLNNYTEQEVTEIDSLFPEKANYLIYGKEKGDSNTPHLQGYVELKKQTLFTTVKKYMPRAHIEMRKGTAEQALDYCKKDNLFTEHGKPGGQGRRTDLDKVRELALDGGMRAVTAVGNFQQIRVAEEFLTYHEEPRNWKPKTYWLWGQSEAGKTKLAHQMCENKDVYVKIGTNKWWNGYDGHTHVIIDDFRKEHIPFVDLLGILDRYEYRIEAKGKMRQFLAKTIVVTSIYSPQQMYSYTTEPIEQLTRRLDQIIEVKKDETPQLINLNLKNSLDIIYDVIDDFDLPADESSNAIQEESSETQSSS